MEQCVEYSATQAQICAGVSYEAAQLHGFENCYLKSSSKSQDLSVTDGLVVDSAFAIGYPVFIGSSSSTTTGGKSSSPSSTDASSTGMKSLTPTNAASSSSASSSSASSSSETQSAQSTAPASSTSQAGIAGAAVGLAVGVALAAFVIFYLCRRRRRWGAPAASGEETQDMYSQPEAKSCSENARQVGELGSYSKTGHLQGYGPVVPQELEASNKRHSELDGLDGLKNVG
jgi:hypothetical protein